MVDSTPNEGDRIVIELYPGEPVELGDLSGSFAALARMYERHYRQTGEEAPKLRVTKLQTGSVIMEIAPYAVMMGQAVVLMDNGIIVADFTDRLWRGIKAFSSSGTDVPRIDAPSDEDARDIKEFARPLLGKRGAALGIKHAKYAKQDGDKTIVVEYTFDEAELNRAAINLDRKLEPPSLPPPANEEPFREQIKREVMLFMDQANRGPGKEKGRTGDKGVIPDVSEKPLPVYFRKSFQNLKDQITKEINPLTSTFVVDVHVQYVEDQPKGYIVTEIHQAVPGDDDAG
jgi:hypothetical protein